MEGPSLYLAQEQLIPFRRKRVLSVTGNTRLPKERLAGLAVVDIFAWGKHLVFQFEHLAVRVHFMLFGTFEADVDGVTVTGDYKRSREPRLALTFPNGEIRLYSCSLKFFETGALREEYDFSRDVLSPTWDARQAMARLERCPEEEIADALLDQEIFAGVGNIIKNEVLSIVRIHPETAVGAVTRRSLVKLIAVTRDFSWQFYHWRKQFLLRKHLRIYQKGACPHCQGKVVRAKTGRRERFSYYCPRCQPLARKDPSTAF